MLESVALLEERELILELPVVYPRHLDDVRSLAERFPALRLVVDHLGKPPIGTAAMAGWEREIRTTAEHPNVLAKISGLNTAIERPDWTADDLLPAVEVALDCFGAERLMSGSDWPVLLLNGDYDRVWDATRRVVDSIAAADAPRLLGETAARVYRFGLPPTASSRSAKRRRTSGSTTDRPGDREDQGTDHVGRVQGRLEAYRESRISLRNSVSHGTPLREAVRALALIGVLDTRVGDGTYVTRLDADLLLTGMGFVGELLDGATLLEVHQVRRILEPVATGLAATRLTEDDFLALDACLEQMEEAETTQAFIDADTEFHRIIVLAAGNATLASLIQNLSGGMLRARLWRTITEQDAVEITRQRHRDIYVALRAGDAERANAADLVHLSEGEEWLRRVIASGEAIGSAGTETIDSARILHPTKNGGSS